MHVGRAIFIQYAATMVGDLLSIIKFLCEVISLCNALPIAEETTEAEDCNGRQRSE